MCVEIRGDTVKRTGDLQAGKKAIVAHLVISVLWVHMDGGTEATPADVFQLLADDYARRILLAADEEPRTAKDLSRICDVSLATVYRRVATLREHDLVDEHSTVGDDGAHRRQFETTLEELHLELTDGELDLSVARRDELADNFTSLWTDIRDST